MLETLFLAVIIVDCFLSTQVISLAKLLLLGITCLFITSKVEEIGVSPPIMHFLHYTSYTKDEVFLVEQYVLKTLE